MPRDKVLVAQGGGPTAVINQSLVGVVLEARKGKNAGCVYGAFHGVRGIVDEDFTNLSRESETNLEKVAATPSSALGSTRDKPDEKYCREILASLQAHGIDRFFYIGGNDSSNTLRILSQQARKARYPLRCVHVPKTIDNDIPLPGNMPTFGFQTARHVGVGLVHNLMEDARTTGRWYLVVTMGRKAGHLTLGIGKASGATLSVIAEEFPPGPVALDRVCDILEGAILKRRAMGHVDGVALVAEGIGERLDPEELKDIPGVEVEYDPHGHIELREIPLAHVLKNKVEERFAVRGEKLTMVDANLGYELRSAPPIPFDCEYVRDLG
ncbi:MAG: 6-phosphofructokinase, partial [Alphaproteobacteria bacterium]|nr:6-phosphofructokinase [Alphaproteobacteria bacterium]